MQSGVSVIICCYNSARRIPETLQYIAKQLVPENLKWEVIIVDNASSDDTPKIAQAEWEKHKDLKVDFRIVTEVKPGLNNARFCGSNAAIYDVLLFCDDDNLLSKDYLLNAFNNLSKYPKLGIAGAGNAYGKYEINPPPKWFIEYQHFCCVYQMGDIDKIDLNCDESVLAAGAGMCIRKSIISAYFKAQDKESAILDRVKDGLSSGGDTDINYFCLKQGFGIGLFSNMNYFHYIPAERIKKSYLKKLAYSLTYSSMIVARKNQVPTYKWNKLGLIKNFIKLLLAGRIFGMQIFWHQYLAQKKALTVFNHKL